MARGQLRVCLGAAAGVGKTHALLTEARRLEGDGVDVVVGVVDCRGRASLGPLLDGLELVAPGDAGLAESGGPRPVLDLAAVLARRPGLVVIDDLAARNSAGAPGAPRNSAGAPGAPRNSVGAPGAPRWQDVVRLLAEGIDVLTALDVDQLASSADLVAPLRSDEVDLVPDALLDDAARVEVVDTSAGQLLERLAGGELFAVAELDARGRGYYEPGALGLRREIALRWMADRIAAERAAAGGSVAGGLGVDQRVGGADVAERVIVGVGGGHASAGLIRRAARLARRTNAELVGVHVVTAERGRTADSATALDADRELLAELGGTFHEVVGHDVAATLLEMARSELATQLVVGSPRRRTGLGSRLRRSTAERLLRQAGTVDVHAVPVEESEPEPLLNRDPDLPDLPVRRQLLGWLLLIVGLPALTLLLLPFREHLNLASCMLVYLLLVMATALVGGTRPALVAAVVSPLVINVMFTAPFGSWIIASSQELVSLVAFLSVGAVVSSLVSQLSRRSVEAHRARNEAEALARAAGDTAGGEESVAHLVDSLRTTFGMGCVALLVPVDDEWSVLASSGDCTSFEGLPAERLSEGGRLVYDGPPLTADDRRVLRAFVSQLDAALARRRLESEAARAAAFAQADRLRTAILRAVSHDLRTPLASIKASATSLLADDVEWSPEARHDFLTTIDTETDRLNVLVGNLLDMSRIEAGALHVAVRPVGLDDVVPQALHSISGPRPEVVVEVPETVPQVLADPALLERVVANLTTNALRHAPAGVPVRIEAGAVGDRVSLRVVDRGRGVPTEERDRIFEPFQRLGDQSGGPGVGLGLAVARGFVDAMNGDLLLEDTPGGGLTAVVNLPMAS